jgi:hypothetical protein
MSMGERFSHSARSEEESIRLLDPSPPIKKYFPLMYRILEIFLSVFVTIVASIFPSALRLLTIPLLPTIIKFLPFQIISV